MKHTGTAITDAPGAMANYRDTIRALNSASEAAIILFVLNGDNQISDEDRKQLRTLREAGLSDKVVFALNFKDNPQVIRNVGIEKDILAVLSQEGFNAPHHQNLLYFNAFLAVRAFQGEQIVGGTLDTLSERGILEDAKMRGYDCNSVEEAWKKTTAQILSNIGNRKLASQVDDMTLTPENKIIQQIREVSRWDEMISSLRAHVLNNRASGVLLDLGARPVIKALESIEKNLETPRGHSQKGC